MEIECYEQWAALLEQRIVSMKRNKREQFFRQVLGTAGDTSAGRSQECLFIPSLGVTVGQLAYYTLINAKKNRTGII